VIPSREVTPGEINKSDSDEQKDRQQLKHRGDTVELTDGKTVTTKKR